MADNEIYAQQNNNAGSQEDTNEEVYISPKIYISTPYLYSTHTTPKKVMVY